MHPYLNQVCTIARQAGDEIMAVYHGEINIESKVDGSPLTQADQRAHHLICQALAEMTPDIPVLSEESADEIGDERLAWPQYWLVDPLDGTKEFIKRNGEFTVNIALIVDTKPVLGVVYVPVSKVCYTGAIGQQATRQEGDGAIKPIQVRRFNPSTVTMVASRSHLSDAVQAFQANLESQFKQVESINMGSSLKLCLVAEGKADIYPRLGLTSEWDTAAAQAVVEAAGGVVLDCDSQTLCYSKPSLLNPWFMVIADTQMSWHCGGLS